MFSVTRYYSIILLFYFVLYRENFRTYFEKHYAYIERDFHPVLIVLRVLGAIMSKTTSISALTLFTSICAVICFEVGAIAKRMKTALEAQQYIVSKKMIFKYREEYEQVVDLVTTTNDILGKLLFRESRAIWPAYKRTIGRVFHRVGVTVNTHTNIM